MHNNIFACTVRVPLVDKYGVFIYNYWEGAGRRTFICVIVLPHKILCPIILNLSTQQQKANGVLQQHHYLLALTPSPFSKHVIRNKNHSFCCSTLLCAFLAFITHPSYIIPGKAYTFMVI